MRTKFFSMLPEEMLLEILYRLPVESLVRFRCVCKTWHQIIATPCFNKAHISHQTASTSNKYILYEDNNLCMLLTDSDPLFDGTKHSKLYYTTPELFVRDVTCNNCYVEIHGVCNGLLCLSYRSSDTEENIFLWNPICRKAKKLPQPGISIKDEYGCNLNASVSFGYDGEDYKVILVAHVNKSYLVSVYSLSTNSWKLTNTSFYSEAESDEFSFLATKFIDGTAYMMTSSSVVVCFDLTNETIRVIRFPKQFCATGHVTMEAYRETIAILGHEKSCLTMWILRDKSSSSTSPWEKKFSIELQEVGHHHAVGFLNNGKYMVRTFNFVGDLCVVTKLYMCDLECPKLTEIRSLTEFRSRFGLPPKYPNFQGRIHSNYTGSLLLFNEDGVDPFVHTDMESSSCDSMLFTLQWDITQ